MSQTMLLALGIAGVFGGLLVALVALGVGTRERAAVGRSLAAIDALENASPDLRQRELDRPFGERVVEPTIAGFSRLGRRFTPAQQTEGLARRLELAGSPEGWTVDRVLASKVMSLIIVGILGLLLSWQVFRASLGVILVVTLGAMALGYFLPNIVLVQLAQKRQERIRKELPDALDLLTISVEAGLAFDAAMAQVAKNSEGPLAEEFFRTLSEMQIGKTRSEALRDMGERCGVEELSAFTTAMVQADAFGIPIANVLRVQAKEMRIKRRQRAEEQAQKVPVKIIVPVVFCILPVLFIIVIGPGAISIFRELFGQFG